VIPELGVSPLTGSPPFLGPVEVADAILSEPEKEDVGVEVLICQRTQWRWC